VMRRLTGAIVVAVLLSGCVGPVRSFSTYEGKAATTAESNKATVTEKTKKRAKIMEAE